MGIALLAALLACSDSTGEPATGSTALRELLAAPPVTTRETPGRIYPTRHAGWGAFDGGGWKNTRDGDGPPPRRSVPFGGEAARLELEVLSPIERELRFVVDSRKAKGRLGISVNEHPLEPEPLRAGRQEVSRRVPADLWTAGPNRIVFHRMEDEGTGESPVGLLGIGDVRLEPSETIAREADGWSFAAGTSAAWPVELAGRAQLTLRARSDGAGRARLRLESVHRTQGEATLVEERSIDVAAGVPAIDRIALPDPRGRALRVWVHWDAPVSAAPLLVESLALEESQPLDPPSVLFLSIDTLAAASLSAYGYGRPTTPNLARLADDGVLFERARSNAPWTIPSYASQFTGLYSNSNRAKSPEGAALPAWDQFLVSDRRWTLAEMMKGAGYRTAAFVDNLWLSRVRGLSQGFDVYDTEAAERVRFDPEGGMRLVFPKALAFLEQHRPEPVFAFAQVMDVHGPYLSHGEFHGRFSAELDPADAREYPVVRSSPAVWGGVPESIAVAGLGSATPPERVDAERIRASYDEVVLEMDAELGRLLDSLKERGLYDDLLILFSADHGESMIDHEFLFHHAIVYDSAIHVPLIVKLPYQERAGSVVTTPVQLVDLYPTLADVAGLRADRFALHGRSLLPALRGEPLEAAPSLSQARLLNLRAIAHGRWKLLLGEPTQLPTESLATHPEIQARMFERHREDFLLIFGGPPPVDANVVVGALEDLKHSHPRLYLRISRGIRDSGPIVELYDITRDPGEEVNLAQQEPEVVARLTALLEVEHGRMRSESLGEAVRSMELDEDTLEELRRLGYVGDEE